MRPSYPTAPFFPNFPFSAVQKSNVFAWFGPRPLNGVYKTRRGLPIFAALFGFVFRFSSYRQQKRPMYGFDAPPLSGENNKATELYFLGHLLFPFPAFPCTEKKCAPHGFYSCTLKGVPKNQDSESYSRSPFSAFLRVASRRKKQRFSRMVLISPLHGI